MLQESGDLWTWNHEGRWVVVTTNIGWKRNGANPMGAGVARVAANKYPDLPQWYGARCKKYGADTAVAPYYEGKLFLFPTKPLNIEQPWMSWQNDSCVSLIRRSCKQLAALIDILDKRDHFIAKVGLPLPGCGNGNLSPRDVLPVISDILDDRFVLLGSDF